MKKLISLLLLSLSFSSMAYEIKCSGTKTKASLELSLSGGAFILDKGDYFYAGKLLSTSGYQVSLNGHKAEDRQSFQYKFYTLKKHALAPKNSKLSLLIKQDGLPESAFMFILNETYSAVLKLEVDGVETELDTLVCEGI